MELTQSQKEDKTVCTVACTAPIISGNGRFSILRDLATGIKRFNLWERSLQGISPKKRAIRLCTLEEKGIILHQTFGYCTCSPRIFSDRDRPWLGIRDWLYA